MRNRGGYIFRRIRDIADHIQSGGQLESIRVIWIGGRLYPLDGMKRLVALLALGKKRVDIQVEEWIGDYSVESPYFDGMARKEKSRFLKWRAHYYESGRIAKEYPTVAALNGALLPIPKLSADKPERPATSGEKI
jgi:hypothetical protein